MISDSSMAKQTLSAWTDRLTVIHCRWKHAYNTCRLACWLRSVVLVQHGERAGAGNKEQIKPRDCSSCCSAVRKKITRGLLSFHLAFSARIGQNPEFKNTLHSIYKCDIWTKLTSKPTTMTVCGIYLITIRRNFTVTEVLVKNAEYTVHILIRHISLKVQCLKIYKAL